MDRRDNQLLFVYGSLKRAGRHHAELRGAAFVGEASTAPGHALEALGDSEYVALVRAPGSLGTVPGELFIVDDELLAALDEFEGPEYERSALNLTAAAEFPANGMALAYFRRTR